MQKDLFNVDIHYPYVQGSNSVMQGDWLKTFESDAMIGHHPVMPAHCVTTQFLIRHEASNTSIEQQFRNFFNKDGLHYALTTG